MHCTIMFLAHVWLISLIDHVYTELELEVPTEQVQVEDFTNLVLTQCKPRYINQCFLSFILNISLCFTWLCIIKSIGIGWQSSCIRSYLPDYPCWPYLGGTSLAHAMLRWEVMVEVKWRLPLTRRRACSLSSSIDKCCLDNLRPGGAIRGISGTLRRKGQGECCGYSEVFYG
jgi:hypothetical protein